jgi:hypothetical protein
MGLVQELPGPEQCRGGLFRHEQVEGSKEKEEEQGLQAAEAATLQFHRVMTFKGCDVRMGNGSLYDPSCYPRRSVDTRRWRWRVCMAYRMSGQHINALELMAVHIANKWRARSACSLGKRFVHFTDSQVAQAALTKGRSSSNVLQRILKKNAALVLAASFQPGYAYVRTSDNPADGPSRFQQWGAKQ